MEKIKLGTNGKTIECLILTIQDPEINKIIEHLRMTNEQKIDIIQEQRPNIRDYDTYSKITLSYPTNKTLENSKMMQIDFVIEKNKLIIILSEENEMTNKAFKELKEIKCVNNVTHALSHFIDSIREQSIKIFDRFEDYLNEKNKEINEGKTDNKTQARMRDLHGIFYYMIMMLKGNTEVIDEILEKKISYIKPEDFGEQQDDRALYFLDLIQVLTRLINNNIESYKSLITDKLNKQIYKLTILGAVLIIPTIMSGYFGMNVNLPGIEFWEIVGASIILSIIAYFVMR